jgi:hypothetical protein
LEQTIGALIGGELAASLPVPAFMSFGIYEAGGTAVLSVLGLDKGNALIAMLSVHIWSQLYDYIFGGMCALMFVWAYKNNARDKVLKPNINRWIKYTAAALVLLFGLLLLAKEYRGMKKRGALSPPQAGKDVSASFTERLSATNNELKAMHGYAIWSSSRFGNHDIVRMDLPTRKVTRITDHPHAEFFPRISPDGRRVLFSRSQQPWVSQRNLVAWDLFLIELDTGTEKLIAKNAIYANWVGNNTITYLYKGHTVVKKETGKLVGETVLYKSGKMNRIPYGALISTPEYNPTTGQLVFTGKQSDLGMNSGGYWCTAVYSADNSHLGISEGCQISFSTKGNYLYQVTKGSKFNKKENQFIRIDPITYESRTLFDMDDAYSHEYFPKDSNDGQYLVFGASADGHEHDTADYEIFLWKIGSNPHYATRLTFHSGNDNWPDVYIYNS